MRPTLFNNSLDLSIRSSVSLSKCTTFCIAVISTTTSSKVPTSQEMMSLEEHILITLKGATV